MRASLDQYIPQTVDHRRPLIMWMIVAVGSIIFLSLIVACPLAQANGFHLFSVPVYSAFSLVCHQLPERSFFVAGHQFAVCGRCTGLYFGFAAAVILYPLLSSIRRTQTPERKWLFIAALPLAIDFGLGLVGLWENTHSSRFSTGALLGAVAAFFVMPGVVELSLRIGSSRKSPQKSAVDPIPPSSLPSEQIATAPSDYSAPFRRI